MRQHIRISTNRGCIRTYRGGSRNFGGFPRRDFSPLLLLCASLPIFYMLLFTQQRARAYVTHSAMHGIVFYAKARAYRMHT